MFYCIFGLQLNINIITMRLFFQDKFIVNSNSRDKVIDSIVANLQYIDADNINKDVDTIFFKNESRKLRQRMSLMQILDEGTFNVHYNNNQFEVFYESKSSILKDIVAITLFLILGITFDAFILLFSLFLFVQIFIKIYLVRTGNKALIKKVLTRLGEDPAIEVNQECSFRLH